MEENKDNDNVCSNISLKIQSTIVEALLNALDDSNDDLGSDAVIEALKDISKKYPNVFIATSLHFVVDSEMHEKISTKYTELILSLIFNMIYNEYISEHLLESLSAESASILVELAVNRLSGEFKVCGLLSAIGKINCAQVMDGLLTKLEPGVIPHPAIISTMGEIAARNPYEILPFIKTSLRCVLPMLSQIQDEHLKQSICFMIEKFCEAINDYITNTKDSSPEISKQSFKEEICSAFDLLVYTWLKTSRDFKSTDAIFKTLVPMIFLLHEEDNDRIAKLVPVSLNVCKRQGIRLAAVRFLTSVLVHCTKTESSKETIRPFMDVIYQTVFEIVSEDHFIRTYELRVMHYKALICVRYLINLYPNEGLDRILQQLKSPDFIEHNRAQIVLENLLSNSEDDGILQRIALNLLESLEENQPLEMVRVIKIFMEQHPFSLLPSQRKKFVLYMVSHCAEDLYSLATTTFKQCHVEFWLWPCLVQTLLNPAYTKSVTSVLHSLSPIATKILFNEESWANERDFPSTKVLARCLELLDDPEKRIAVLSFLKSAAHLIGHQVKNYWDEVLTKLEQQFLQDAQRSTEHENNSARRNLAWEEQIVEWLEQSVKLEGESWGTELADELALNLWNTVPNVALYLASVCTKDAHISLLVELARSNGTTRQYARAVGICAKRHLNIVLKLMGEFCATKDVRESPVTLLGLVRDAKAAATTETAKTGLLQCYGEIAQRGDPEKLFPMFEKHVLPWIIKQLTECKEQSTKETGLSVLEQIASAVRSIRFPESKGLSIKASALTTLIEILQSPSGYRPLPLYPAILKAANSLICIPPALTGKKRVVFLSAILNKTISAGSEIALQLHPELMYKICENLVMLSNEIVSKSSGALTELVNILLRWIQSKWSVERHITLLVLHALLKSYSKNLNYTYFTRCVDALLERLEEPASSEGGSEVTLECLRGLTTLLSAQYKKPVSTRVVLTLKPFIEKGNWEMKLAAIEALGALAVNWKMSVSVPTDDMIDHLLDCLPSLIIRLKDSIMAVVQAAQNTLCEVTFYYVVRSKKLSQVIKTHLRPEAKLRFKRFSKELIGCLKDELPEKAEELRNVVVRYSESENPNVRATSALLLGLFGSPRLSDVERLTQLLRDTSRVVRARALQALVLL